MASEAWTQNEDSVSWQDYPQEKGIVRGKHLIDGDYTPSHGMTLGLLELPPGTELAARHHAPQEIYFIRSGIGELRLGDETRRVKPGDVIYIPENTLHGISNPGTTRLEFLWFFPTDTWSEIEYHYANPEPDAGQ